MPIGNLTSQIFANIYLNELDRFVKHELKVRCYLRYGDDFIILDPNLQKLNSIRDQVIQFLEVALRLKMNPKSDKILMASHGLKFLGVIIRPDERMLNRRNCKRIKRRLSYGNVSSYYGLVKKHALSEFDHELDWRIYDLLESEF